MKTDAALAIVAAGFLVFGGLSAWAEDKVDPALAKAVSEATVPLEQAIKTSEREGKPISGKYEIKSGAFQLSVYTTKGGEFKEVIVDHKSGSITKTEPITNAGDLQQAKEQAQSLVHARVPLDIGVGQAVRGNSGYRAIEVVATVDRAGKPVAFVTLTKGDDVKKVTEGLE